MNAGAVAGGRLRLASTARLSTPSPPPPQAVSKVIVKRPMAQVDWLRAWC